MNRAQLLGIAIASVCGLGAFVGVRSLVEQPQTVVREEVSTNLAQVLVARADIPLGNSITPESFRWQDWPTNALGPNYIQRSARPNAIKDLVGAVARAPMLPGEPVTPLKIVKLGDGGVLAAILPKGMRAISTRIREETGVGRLILPNDRVDVLLSIKTRNRSGNEESNTETLFQNVRVLAIGQLIEARDGKKLAEGNTATLELTPEQSEQLAAANGRGEISFALRSIADIQASGPQGPVPVDVKRESSIRIWRYGRPQNLRVN